MTAAFDIIVVMAKSPIPGAVKTRMCPPLHPTQAASLAEALLGDTTNAASATGASVWCAVAGPPAPVAAVVDSGIRLVRQRGAGLAERLCAAQMLAFGAGARRVLLLGADCPTADTMYLTSALRALDDVDVAIGPAHDGGYVLLASSKPTPELFAGVSMGTSMVLRQTLAAAAAGPRTVLLLPPRHDIDVRADLDVAFARGQLAHAHRTMAWVSQLVADDLPPVLGEVVSGVAADMPPAAATPSSH